MGKEWKCNDESVELAGTFIFYAGIMEHKKN
jgi:hypothetical protein